MGSKQSIGNAPRVFYCRKGHILTVVVRDFVCDVCQVTKHGAVSFYCKECDYDSCPAHQLLETSTEKDGTLKLEEIRCPKNHRLVLSGRTTDWVCDVCQAPHAAKDVSANCIKCDYDECLSHRIVSSRDSANVTYVALSQAMKQLDGNKGMTPGEVETTKMKLLLSAIRSEKSAAHASTTPVIANIVPRFVDPFQPTPPQPPLTWGISSAQWTKPSIYEAPYVSINNDPQSDVVFIRSCVIESSICAFVARCTVELCFENTSSRALEGEVVFPLPEEAVVLGYALEIGGELVAASLVESKKAEKIYEAEVRKGVDPGLLQKVAAGGNAFKTRVYPLPANGTRRLSITYTQPLDTLDAGHGGFTFNLSFKRPVMLTLNSKIFSPKTAPIVEGACTGATIEADGCGMHHLQFISKSFSNTDSALRVVVPLPGAEEPFVIVEKSAVQSDGNGWYFAINDCVPPPAAAVAKESRHSTAVIWDASLSRADADVAEELKVLRLILEQQISPVDVYIVRDRVEVYLGLNAEGALQTVHQAANDGGTSLHELHEHLAANISKYDRILLFSDGQSTIGEGRVPCIEGADCPPVFCFSSSVRCNYSQLHHYWAGCTGGAFLRVGRQPAAEVAAAVATRSAKIVTVTGDSDSNPLRSQSLAGSPRFLVTGRIPSTASPDANGNIQINVVIALATDSYETRQYHVNIATAVPSDVIQQLWAQQRISQLEVFPEANGDEILAIGRAFGMVTSSTSLLVLETLSQHLEHLVVPHPQRAAMYRDYMEHVSSQQRTEQERVNQKLQTVEGYWDARKSWYKKDFEGPKRKEMEKCKKECARPSASMEMCCAPPPPCCAAPARSMRCSAPAQQEECLDRCAEEDCDEEICCAVASGEGGGSQPPPRSCAATATVKYWSPDTPYLKAIAAAPSVAEQYSTYLSLRSEYAKTPAFYFDVGGFFLNPQYLTEERRVIGLRILSNIAELALDNSRVLRVLGYKLFEAKEWALASEIFCRVALWRPTEPQSYRDLGLTLLERGWYQQALELLWRTITMEVPSAFAEIEVEALWEIRDCLTRATRHGFVPSLPAELQARKSAFLDGDMSLDLRVTMGWDQDNVDLDLHVIEPTGEEAYYGHKETEIGGLMSRDFRQGYGPESYVIKKAYKGTYRFKTNYFASHMPSLTGPTVAILSFTTNFLRPQQHTVYTLIRLNEAKDNGEIGSVAVQ